MEKNDIDVNSVVAEDFITKTSPYNGKYSKTTLFLLPMLGLSLRNANVLRYLKNSYLDDRKLEHDYKKPIFLLFNVNSLHDQIFKKFQEVLRKKVEYVYDYYVGLQDGRHLLMYVFEIQEKYRSDYNHFKAGRYSKFSKEYRELFPQYVQNALGKDVESIAWGAINKSKTLRDKIMADFELDRNFVESLEELWDSPKREEEYYRFNKSDI